ncbi:hypothetical protein Pyn_35783 [Prunus yedoensis var. nudiflora]|uniref:Uncharacterized protein n=1 Tax=Prunus yedoensis var. nudiflora TaxID=2094558 RepID=A0A314Z266_PRUYE|nr:hypothetical protein Pyn_35783 [Prunus yedoensis var. nudiflora]
MSESDRNCVVKGSPWTFENAPLILGETDGLEDPHRVPLTTQPFRVRVKGVPLAYMERSTGQLIGDILGRAKVKEWLNEHEMKPPRPLKLRWVMKALSSDELGLADEVQRLEEDEDEGGKLRQGTINENNGSIMAGHHKRRKLCNEAIQGDLNHELILGNDSLAFNSPVTVEKGKNTIDNGGVFSPTVIGIKNYHNSNILGPAHPLLKKGVFK